MAVDPNIIMSGQSIDTATPLSALSQGVYNKNAADVAAAKAAEQQTYSRQQDAQKMAMEQERQALEEYKTKFQMESEENKSQARNAVINSVRISSLSNPDEITKFLNNPKNLHSESDLLKRDLWMKNPTLENQEFKQYNESDIAIGGALGIIKRQSSQNSPAAIQIADEIKKARSSGDTQRVNDLLLASKALEKGQITDSDGNVILASGVEVASKTKAEAIASGKKAGELQTEKKFAFPKATAALNEINASHKNVLDTIDAVLPNVNYATSGFASLSKFVPGTPAADMASMIDTIEANLAFDKLQAMRDASPTGGAIGQVSDTEERMLAAAWSSVKSSQSPQQLSKNLTRLKGLISESDDRAQEAYQMDYADFISQPKAPSKGGVKFLGFE